MEPVGERPRVRPGTVWPVPVDPEGRVGPTRSQARGTRWRRTSKGLFVPSRVPRTAAQRIVEAAAVLPDVGAVTGWGSLHWRGGRWFDGFGVAMRERPVPLVTSVADIRAQPGFAVSAEGLDPRDIDLVDGVRVTHALRSVLFEMRYAESLRDAVRVLDMAAYSDLVSIAEVREYCLALSGKTGIPQARAAVALAEENAWSPVEVDLRLVWRLDAGLEPPLCNRPVFDLSGRHVMTPDLFDAELGVAGEYDGSTHLGGRQRTRDLARADDCRRLGITSFSVVAGDLASTGRIVQRIHRARATAATTVGPRRWTIDPPHWWVPTWSVDQRRALDAQQRRTWLGYRAA